MNLFSLTEEYKKIMELAEDPEVDPEIIATHLEVIEMDIKDKADSIAYIMAQLDGDVETIKKEEERLYKMRNSLTANRERLKKYLEASMKATGMTKFKTTMHSFWIQKNRESVRLVEGEPIPEQFLIPQEPKVDNVAILAALKSGKEFKFAQLQQTDGVRIR